MTKLQVEKMAQDMIESVRNSANNVEYKKAAIENIIKMKNDHLAKLDK